jgi:putative ABC transport system permease protein
MSWWRRLVAGERMEKQLDAEMRDHLERQIADYVREGLQEAEARRRANLLFGGLEQVKEDCRDARGTRWAEELVRDLRHAARVLGRSRRFAVTAALAIALGIGTNATFFSLVHEVLLRALPYRASDRLIALSEWHPQRGRYGKVSGADFQEWSARAPALEDVACYWDRGYTVTNTGQPESLVGWQFSGNLFGLLGASPLLGRTLLPDDAQAGRDDVAVISEELWRRRFGGDTGIVGRTIPLDGRHYTIVGVMPREFAHPAGRTDVWTPLVLGPDVLADRDRHPLRVIARLRPGVTREQAQAEMTRLAAQLAREHPQTNAGWRVDVTPIRDLYVGNVRPLLLLLQGAVFLLLLIASANVGSLVLARAAAREREIALRLALGARPAHLARQFLAEGILLALLGGLGGLALAAAGVQIVPIWLGDQLQHLPKPDSVPGWIGPTVLLATAAATLAVGVALGLVPLARGLRLAHGPLKSEGRGLTDGVRARRLRQGLVIIQVALSVCLLVEAGLLVRSFARLQERSLGFRTDGVLTGVVVLPPNRYPGLEQAVAFLEPLVERLRATPGVEAAGLVSTLPLTGMNARRPYQALGLPDRDQVADFRVATPQYVSAMGIPLRQGRLFDERDRAGAEGVVLINETLARRLWPGRDPVGQVLVVADMATPAPRKVVGVVGDTRHDGLATEPQPEIYRPAYQAYWPFYGIAIRTHPGVRIGGESLRSAVAALDRDLPVTDVRSLHERAVASMAWRRSSMALLGVFAWAALLLAAFGVYGVVSYAVVQARREIGVRMALGAQPAGVAREFLARGAVLAGWGMAAGLALSVFLTHTLEGLLFGVARLDGGTYLTAAGLTFLVTVLAASAPARAAGRVDPVVALRVD